MVVFMGAVVRFDSGRTLRMEVMVVLLVLMVVGLRMAAVVRNILVVLMFSANLTLVAMCSVVGSMMLAARCAIFTLFLEMPPAFGLVGAGVFGYLEMVLVMVLSLSCLDIYWY